MRNIILCEVAWVSLQKDGSKGISCMKLKHITTILYYWNQGLDWSTLSGLRTREFRVRLVELSKMSTEDAEGSGRHKEGVNHEIIKKVPS